MKIGAVGMAGSSQGSWTRQAKGKSSSGGYMAEKNKPNRLQQTKRTVEIWKKLAASPDPLRREPKGENADALRKNDDNVDIRSLRLGLRGQRQGLVCHKGDDKASFHTPCPLFFQFCGSPQERARPSASGVWTHVFFFFLCNVGVGSAITSL